MDSTHEERINKIGHTHKHIIFTFNIYKDSVQSNLQNSRQWSKEALERWESHYDLDS